MQTHVTIDRVRAARSKISSACAHDPEKLVAYYMEMQKKIGIAYGCRQTPRTKGVAAQENAPPDLNMYNACLKEFGYAYRKRRSKKNP